MNSHRKHEEALQELSKRRTEQKHRLHHSRPTAGPGTVIGGQGASGGKKFKNKYLNDFNKIKREHLARKEQRQLPQSQGQKKVYLSSQTAPGAVQSSGGGHGNYGGHAMAAPRRPPPTTKTAGTVTRRVTNSSMPTRRQYGRGGYEEGSSSTQKMPAIVGSGVGGVRALREQRRGR